MNESAISTIPIHTIQSKAEDFPDILRHIPDPPAQLYVRSASWHQLLRRPWIAIVGSRKLSAYGRAVTTKLATDVAQAGLVVVSGLAIGADGVAHRAALAAKGLTVAVLAGGLDRIYPGSHRGLAHDILAQGGALVSEYAVGQDIYASNFIARNRLVSGLSQAIIITEAAEKSGTLHTARFALEQGREVFAVPGNITSSLSAATNRLIQSGATPITSSNDLLQSLGLARQPTAAPKGDTPAQQAILDLLVAGETDGAVLLAGSQLDVALFNQALTMLEISGKIRALGGNKWALGI